MAFPIVEYRTDYEMKYDGSRLLWVPVWQSKRSIDLRWVSSARPMVVVDDIQWTIITLSGSPTDYAIDCQYEDFMRDWMKARA